SLEVSRGPVIQYAKAEHMRLRRADADAFALGIAPSDENAQLQLVVQPLARAEAGRTILLRGTRLAHGTWKGLARNADAGCASVVADGHPFVVGQQGIVGAELLAHRCGMVQ